MDKKNDKKVECKNCGSNLCVTIGFWLMLILLLVTMLCSYLNWAIPSLIAGLLFVLSIFFVFISSIKAVAPAEKSMAYIALAITIIFILFLILFLSFGIISSGTLK